MRSSSHKHGRRWPWIVFVISLVIVGGLGITIGKAMRPATVPVRETSSVSRSKASTSTTKNSKSVDPREASSASMSQGQDQSDSDDANITITNYADYADLNGDYYFGNQGEPISLEFDRGQLVSRDAYGAARRYQINAMLKHPDGSLVANASAMTRNADDEPIKINLSILIVPKDITLTKNWQSGVPLSDLKTQPFPRIAVANSPDDGKSVDMAPAYQAFEHYEADSKTHLWQNGSTTSVGALIDYAGHGQTPSYYSKR